MVKELLLVHHTHTDIGYTHPQPVVHELHHRFIDKALDLADAGAGEREDARFRWTCEVTATTRKWWEAAGNEDRDRFLAAVARGQFEVAAMEWHLTPLADLRMLVRSLENVKFFRELGIPVRSAMHTDVNGVPWGLVDVLLDHGVTGFSMSTNSHFGGPVEPRPGAFRWKSPSGRELLVWNGFQYWHAANHLMRMPSGVEEVSKAMPWFLENLENKGFDLPFLPMQITNIHHPDNAEPDPGLAPFVKDWNDLATDVKLRTVLLSEVFDELRKLDLPVLEGDWTDYWNFGAGSSARETAVYMEGLRVLNAAHQISAWPGEPEKREQQHLDSAHDSLALYAEHTWGADRSTTHPESIETHLQWSLKSATAYEGMAHARIVLRDSLHRLSSDAAGYEPHILLYNPLPTAVKTQVRLPFEGLDWALNKGVHHLQRLDGSLSDLKDESTRWTEVELPAMGYRAYPLKSLPVMPDDGLAIGSPMSEEDQPWIKSDRILVKFGVHGGVESLLLDGKELAGSHDDFTFGVPVLEQPDGGTRGEIMTLHFQDFELGDGWVKDWARTHTPGSLVKQASRQLEGAVEHHQTFFMANGDLVEVVYRLFSAEPTVDLEVILTSSGTAKPSSLALPFVLPQAGLTTWHFDTAGAVVEFDREQLPNACQHYVTAHNFVRMQTEEEALSISTPDLPLWMFGGMFFAPTSQLDPADRRPVTLAWLSNSYWEVNFRANQNGQTRYRMRLIPHKPEPIADSVCRAMPYSTPPVVHACRSVGNHLHIGQSLMTLEGQGVSLESFSKKDGSALLILQNLADAPVVVTLSPGVCQWSRAFKARMDGSPVRLLPSTEDAWQVELAGRETAGVLLEDFC